MAQKLMEGEDLKTFDYTSKKFIISIQKFFDSPFKEDKKYVLLYLSKLTRDRL